MIKIDKSLSCYPEDATDVWRKHYETDLSCCDSKKNLSLYFLPTFLPDALEELGEDLLDLVTAQLG